MLTSAGVVLQLMESDVQFALPEFPVVLAYNRVNHYLPTAFLSNDSLLNWQLSTVNQLFEGAQTFFLEAQPQMHKEPELCTELEGIFAQITEIKHKMHDRVKLGTTAATSVPLILTGKKPKRSDTVGRWGEIPQRSIRTIDIPQPHFADILENPALPYYQRKQLEDPSPEKP